MPIKDIFSLRRLSEVTQSFVAQLYLSVNCFLAFRSCVFEFYFVVYHMGHFNGLYVMKQSINLLNYYGTKKQQ